MERDLNFLFFSHYLLLKKNTPLSLSCPRVWIQTVRFALDFTRTCQGKIVVRPAGDRQHVADALHKARDDGVFIRTTANLSIIILPVGRRAETYN